MKGQVIGCFEHLGSGCLHAPTSGTVSDIGLHPMIDQTERLKRLASEAADPEVGLVLLDVVLGEGAHADPAGELAPVVRTALETAAAGGRELRIVVILIGTEDDPQDLASQRQRLEAAGAVVVDSVRDALRHVPPDRAEQVPTVPMLPKSGDPLDRIVDEPERAPDDDTPIDPAAFAAPLAAINVGLESFHTSLVAQGAAAVHVDWRPPAGGDERLLRILDRLRGGAQPEEAAR